MRYNSNEEVLEDINSDIKYEYDKLYKKREKMGEINEPKGIVDSTLTFGTTENIKATIIASIPGAIKLTLGAAGLIVGAASSLPVLNNLGRELGPQQTQIINQISNFAGNAAQYGLENAISGFSLLAIPTTFSAISLPKKFLRTMKQKRIENVEAKLTSYDDINFMLEDIKHNREDSSLDFSKEFLSNVDLTTNSKKFNIQILYYLARHRDAILKYQNRDYSKEELEDTYSDFISFISEGTGASKDFYKSPYVEKIISDYLETKQIQNRYNSIKAM